VDLERKFNQEMTVYKQSPDEFTDSGAPVLLDPIVVKCRWSTTSEKFVTNNGDEVYVKAWISSLEILSEGDLVVLGNTAYESDPAVVGAQELKRDSAIPDLSAEQMMYIYFV
jgi:hypothetical protein